MNEGIAIIDHVGVKGGMHQYSIGLLGGLSNQKVETYYLSNYNNSTQLGVNCRKVFPSNLKKTPKHLVLFLKGVITSGLFLKKKRVRKVILHHFENTPISFSFTLILKLFGFQLTGIIHDISSFGGNDNKLLKKWIHNKLFNKFVVHNKYSFKHFINEFEHLKDKVKIIPHGNYSDFVKLIPQKEAKEKLNLKLNEKHALFFGQIKKVKGLDILLNAFPKNNHKLIIAGKPWKDNFIEYERIISKRNLDENIYKKIRYITDEERELLFCAADFLILPYKEIFQSGVLLLALSYNLPVLVSDLPPNKELLTDKEALFFKSENIADLNKKIITFFTDNEKRDQIQTGAKTLIESKFSWNEISKNYINWL